VEPNFYKSNTTYTCMEHSVRASPTPVPDATKRDD
jgi:hypothetical protein